MLSSPIRRLTSRMNIRIKERLDRSVCTAESSISSRVPSSVRSTELNSCRGLSGWMLPSKTSRSTMERPSQRSPGVRCLLRILNTGHVR